MTDEELNPAPMLRPGPPPLRIHHFLTCMAVAAVTLTVWQSRLPADVLDQVSTAVIAINAVGYVLSAVALTLGMFSIYWYVRGYASLAQPGQWLLVGQVVSTLRYLMVLIPFFRRPDILNKAFLRWDLSESATVLGYVACAAAFYLLPVVFFAWCAWRVADTRAWRILFAVIALSYAIPEWLIFFVAKPSLTPPFVTIWMDSLTRSFAKLVVGVWAMVDDYVQRRPRVWTHWMGAALLVLGEFVTPLAGVAYWLGLL